MGKKKGKAVATTSKDDDDDALLDAAIAQNAKEGLTAEKVVAKTRADKIRHVNDMGTMRMIEENRE